MYHRNNETHLGNPNPCILANEWSKNEELNKLAKEIFEDGINLWFKDIQGCDFNIYEDEKCIEIAFGIEPTYQRDKLKIIIVNSNIKYSSYTTGIAFGAYGSNLVMKRKYYSEYKNKCKFIDFIDRWQIKLQEFFEKSRK